MESRLDADGTQSAVPPQPRAAAGAASDLAPEGSQSSGASAGGGPRGDLGRAAVDEEALRGTRFEFGGRRPYTFAPPRVDTTRQAGRPLPGIGTVALGRVARVTPYGAFVDFLGFRGLVHISQLLPGHRVERVEDVVHDADEVQVRVIGVDPERRHINLALMARLSPGTAAATAQTGDMAVLADQSSVAATTASPASATEEAHAPSDSATGHGESAPSEDAPSQSLLAAAAEPVRPAQQAPQTPPSAPRPPAAPAPRVEAEPSRATNPEPSVGRPAAQLGSRPPAARTAPAPGRPTARPATPPAERPALGRPGPAQPAAGGQPSPAEVARHGARAIRRELMDPRHPMARLLNAAPRNVMGRGADKDRLRPGENAVDDLPVAPPPPPVIEPPRPVHVSGPDPEPQPPGDHPATLEDLAARFGQARPKTADRNTGKSDRSRQEREKQAAILAKLRSGTPAN